MILNIGNREKRIEVDRKTKFQTDEVSKDQVGKLQVLVQ
jgi:hypothetical protein